MKWLRSLFSCKTETIPEDKSNENQQTQPAQEWRYGVAGNITKTHLDDQGILRYGSSAFCGGAKVYLCGKYWTKGQNMIVIIKFIQPIFLIASLKRSSASKELMSIFAMVER